MQNATALRLSVLYILLFVCLLTILSGLYLILIQSSANKAAWYHEAGNRYLENGDPKTANAAFTQSLQNAPLMSQYWYDLAKTQRILKNDAAASRSENIAAQIKDIQ